MRGIPLYGMVAAAFMAGVFLASPELRAYASTIANDVICNGCVGTSDLAGSAVTSAKIKDGEVKATDIATGAVGASEIAADSVTGSELQAVSKLLFGQCVLTNTEATTPVSVHVAITKDCNIVGTDSDDSVIVTLNDMNICLDDGLVQSHNGFVRVHIKNECSIEVAPGAGSTIAVLVYDK